MALELTEEQVRDGWTVQKLGTITTKIGSGATPRGGKSVYIDDGAALVRSQNVYDHELILEGIARIDEDAEKQLRSVKVQGCDVLLNITGDSIARCAYVKPVVEDAYVNQHVCIVRVDSDKADYRYIQKYLAGSLGKKRLLDMSDGATRKALTKKALEEFEIALPPREEQKRVAEILGSLDDKIEANNALLNSLDGLGNALILQKINDVPETCQLSEVAEIVMGQSPAGTTLNEDSEGLIFYQGRRDFGFRYPTPRVFTSAPTRVAEPGDILLSVRAPVGDLNRTDEECCVGRGVAAIRAKNGNTAQLFYLLKNIPNLWSPYEGEGTVFSSINRKQVQNLQIPVVDNFEEFEDIEKAILSLTQENLALSETRDLLIRQLIG